MKQEFKVIADLLPNNTRVLDVGCGDGSLMNFLDKEKNIAGWVYIVDGNAISESEFYKLHSDMASPVFELSQEELCEIKELRLNGSSYGDKYILEIERRGFSCLK